MGKFLSALKNIIIRLSCFSTCIVGLSPKATQSIKIYCWRVGLSSHYDCNGCQFSTYSSIIQNHTVCSPSTMSRKGQ